VAALAALRVVVRRRALLRVVSGAAIVVLLVGLMAFLGGVAAVTGMTGKSAVACAPNSEANTTPTGNGVGLVIRSAGQLLYELNDRQESVARAYISVGKELGIPHSGQIIAIMMALQESSLRMLANPSVPASLNFPNDGVGRDHDSIGSAQQRPAAGWGTVEQLMDVSYNARAFYGGPLGPNRGSPRGLLDVPSWQGMDKGLAAQAVQISTFPELYARWEPAATAIVAALESDTAPAACSTSPQGPRFVGSFSSLSQLRQKILRFTEEGLGGSYIWGGTAFKAWDCSGYVQWIYRQAGIELPRVDQWRVGVRTEDPQPGDLVVQNPQGPDNWGHVGIYAGDGMMWSALNPAAGTLLHPVSWNPGTAYFDLLMH
jgi:cell wall-associated NlpC family hydrolase